MKFRNLGLALAILLMGIGFAISSEPFRDPANLLDRTRLWTEVGLVAIPMTYLIIAGGIDLSVGSLVALSAVMGGIAASRFGVPFPAALAIAALTGVVGGAFNGLLASWLRVPALVATLGTMAIFRGVATGTAQAQPVRGFPAEFTAWGGYGALGPVPQQLLLLIAIAAIAEFKLRRNRIGRWTLALGENETAARFAAVPVEAVRFQLFLASGLVCGIAAICSMGRFASAHPADHAGLELQAIACVVIGGTRITGGSGSITGTMLGLLFLAVLGFGLEMNGIPQATQTVIVGVLVVAIAVLNEWLARRQAAR